MTDGWKVKTYIIPNIFYYLSANTHTTTIVGIWLNFLIGYWLIKGLLKY